MGSSSMLMPFGVGSGKDRERMHRTRMGRLTRVALLLVGLLVALDTVAAITTTESLVEATHTTLPVLLDDRDDDTAARAGTDLTEAESKDPQRLEIIKQIRKVNQDGSYTVGYEADDGTFKIESRDVLGNVKGTYGYIDANGDIKRVSYGGDGQAAAAAAGNTLSVTQARPTTAITPVTEEDIVHIPPRFNRSHHQQLLVPTTRRPPNYQPPVQHLHHNPHHGSTLRPSVIQTIPRKRPGYTTTATAATTTSAATTPTTSTVTSMATSATTAAVMVGSTSAAGATAASMMTAAPEPTTEMPVLFMSRHGGPGVAKSVVSTSTSSTYAGEQSTASSHTAPLLHTKPGLLIIRPTPLPYQTLKTAEQLARPERLVGEPSPKFGPPVPSKKPVSAGVRGNFLRRQLAPTTESAEQFDQQQQQQQQQIVYGQSVSSADGGELYGRPPVYTAHPSPRIPAAVLAARQRAAHIQSVLASQAHSGAGDSRLTTERVYVKQPVRPHALPPVPATHRHHHHEPAPIVYEPSTEPSSENAYVTDSPVGPSVVQIPAANTRAAAAAAAASETDPEAEERPRPIFRPRPTLEYARPREGPVTPGPRYRTPYGLPPPPPPPFGRSPFSSQEHTFGGRTAGDEIDEIEGREPQDPYNGLAAYRQQRRLLLPAAADTAAAYNQQQQQSQHQQPQQQQPQNSYPVPYGRLPPSPYYYDIPAERPLTARDFERILQVLIYRHQQLQVAQQTAALHQHHHRYGYGGPGYNGPAAGAGFPYNPYFPGPSAGPFGLAGTYTGYPQQQIPRPPLPFPYGHAHPAAYDGSYLPQNPLYSPSAPSPSAAAAAAPGAPGPRGGGADHQLPDHGTAGGYGLTASRRQGQYYAPPLDLGGSATGRAPGTSNGDFLPPEVRESLLYRMLMLAIQAPASGEVLPLGTGSTGHGQGAPHHLHLLQGASSMPQANVRTQTLKTPDSASTVAAAATMAPMYSKKPVRSVQILGEE